MLLRVGIIFFLCYLIACSSSKKIANTEVIRSDKTDSLAGLEIVKRSDCVTCHKIGEKFIGPAFTDIAKKYELNIDNVNKLSKKIITGGKSIWGKVSMTPHSLLSEEDAKAMVKYILVLKN
jgi:cytochrome c